MMSFMKFIIILLSVSKIAVTNTLFDASDNLGGREVSNNMWEMFEKLRIRMHMDMTELGIPRLDSLTINEFVLGTDLLDGATLVTTNIKIVGLKSFIVNEANFNIFGMEFLYDFIVPTLTLTGDYVANGLVKKMFPFKGSGQFDIAIHNITLKCDGRLRYSNDGWSVPDLSIYFGIEGFKGGFKQLSDNFLNEMLNDVGPRMLKEIWPFMEPAVHAAAEKIVLQRLEDKSLEDFIILLSTGPIDWPEIEPITTN